MSNQIVLSPYEEKELIWNDISDLEAWRTYHFADGGEYKVTKPVLINVQRNAERGDSHRIIDAFGVRHYVRPGWMAFRFGGVWGIGITPGKKPVATKSTGVDALAEAARSALGKAVTKVTYEDGSYAHLGGQGEVILRSADGKRIT